MRLCGAPRLHTELCAPKIPMRENILIRIGTDSEFDAIYEDMKLQFPPEELKPKSAFKKMFRTRLTKLIVAVIEGEIAGYFIFHKAGDIAMLDHIAVLKPMQSKGIGSFMIGAISGHYSDLKGMFLEVEPAAPGKPDTLRRARFYEKCGLYRVPVNYLMPAPNGRTVRMDVWFLNSSSFGGRISPEEVKSAIRRVFPHVYGVFGNMGESLARLDDEPALAEEAGA